MKQETNKQTIINRGQDLFAFVRSGTFIAASRDVSGVQAPLGADARRVRVLRVVLRGRAAVHEAAVRRGRGRVQMGLGEVVRVREVRGGGGLRGGRGKGLRGGHLGGGVVRARRRAGAATVGHGNVYFIHGGQANAGNAAVIVIPCCRGGRGGRGHGGGVKALPAGGSAGGALQVLEAVGEALEFRIMLVRTL